MPSFTHTHASGLWDAPERAWRSLEWDLSKIASVIAFTETTRYKPNGGRKGWEAYHGGKDSGADECTIAWDTAVWQRVDGFTQPVSRTKYALGNGKVRPDVHVTVVLLREIATGRLICFGVLHAPSAIQGKGGLITGVRRSLAALETFAGWRQVKRQIRRAHPRAQFILSGDWNLDQFLRWVRVLLKARLGMRNGWRDLPKRGSHGSRLIDGVRHSRKLRTRGSRLLERRPPFDHTPLVTEFR